MLFFIFAYTLICAAILMMTVFFAEIDFSNFRHHRIREVSHFLSSQSTNRANVQVQVNNQKRTALDDVDDWLRWLDFPLGLNGRRFMFLVLAYIVLVGVGGGWGLIQSSLYQSVQSNSFVGVLLVWMIFAFGAMIVFTLPLITLRTMAGRRIRKLQRQFGYLLNYFRMFLRMGIQPDAIVLQTFRMIENPLRNRLVQLYAEIQVLGPREAFMRFSDRMTASSGDLSKYREYKIFKDAIVNSLNYGTDASEACGNLSRDLRLRKKDETLKMIKRKPFFIILPKLLFGVSILILVTIPVMQKLFEFVNNS